MTDEFAAFERSEASKRKERRKDSPAVERLVRQRFDFHTRVRAMASFLGCVCVAIVSHLNDIRVQIFTFQRKYLLLQFFTFALSPSLFLFCFQLDSGARANTDLPCANAARQRQQ
jgi:hypothetical protein